MIESDKLSREKLVQFYEDNKDILAYPHTIAAKGLFNSIQKMDSKEIDKKLSVISMEKELAENDLNRILQDEIDRKQFNEKMKKIFG